MTIKLSDAQLGMMSAAAQREDRCLALPEKLRGAAVGKVGGKLIDGGLVREIKAKSDMPVWRRDEGDRPFALKLTASGLKAIEVEDDAASDEAEAAQQRPTPQSSRAAGPAHRPASAGSEIAPRPDSKLAQVIGLLQRSGGATIDDLTEATGWLPHTTRAALTGLRKRGYSVTRSHGQGEAASTYRIAGKSIAPIEPRSEDVADIAASGSRRSRSTARKAA